MSTVPPPVREPAWPLSRSAIGLWVTQGVLGALAYGLAAAVVSVAVPAGGDAPLPVLRWLLPLLAVVYAVVAIGIRPWIRYRVHRWAVTGEAGYALPG